MPQQSIGQATYEAVMTCVYGGIVAENALENWLSLPDDQQQKWENAGQKIQEFYETGMSGAKLSR